MDNDNKVAPASGRQQEVNLFLKDFVGSLKNEGGEPYDLESEYAKTRKNKSWFVIILMAASVLVMVAGTFLFSYYLSQQNRIVPVGIETFDDLNLKNLLNSVARAENTLQTAVNEKASLEAARRVEMDALSLKREADTHTVQALSLPPAQAKSRIAAVERAYRSGETEIAARFDPRIAELSSRIEELRSQMTVFDTSRVEEAQSLSSAGTSERQVFEMEKQQLRDEYEAVIADLRTRLSDAQSSSFKSQIENLDAVAAKYRKEIDGLDPVITDARGTNMLASLAASGARLPYTAAVPVPAGMGLDANLFELQRELYDNLEYLSRFVLATPHKNSLLKYVQGMKDAAFLAGSSMETSMQSLMAFTSAETGRADAAETQVSELEVRLGELQARIADMDRAAEEREAAYVSLLAGYGYYIQSILERNGDIGYVLDPRNQNEMLVYLDPVYDTVDTGSRAFVFRSGTDYIGSVTLHKKDGSFTASVDEMEPGKQFQVNDRILLDISGGGAVK